MMILDSNRISGLELKGILFIDPLQLKEVLANFLGDNLDD